MVDRRPPADTDPRQPSSLSQILDRAAAQLRAVSARPPVDGLLFSGSRHDAVPRALLTDTRLTPLERNAWQVFRMLVNDDGITAFPTYDQLRPYLASVPCSASASDETIARALTILRLTRWLTLVRVLRDPATKAVRGNLYVLHDEPLTPYEVIQLDPHYLTLVGQSFTHASKAIQRVAVRGLRELVDDPLLAGNVLPSRLQVLSERLEREGWTYPQAHSDGVPSSDSEDSAADQHATCLRIPKPVRTLRDTDIYKELRNVRRGPLQVRLPESFGRLREDQQTAALAALQRVDPTLQQPVLDEWAARLKASTVRNPTGYLLGLVQRALRGEFNPGTRSPT